MAEKKAKKDEFLMYKGKPMVRCGNIIYYGNMYDKYVVMMHILESVKKNDMEIASKVLVQLMYTDPDLRAKDRIVKKSEKDGLYNAIDIASIWLNRALTE